MENVFRREGVAENYTAQLSLYEINEIMGKSPNIAFIEAFLEEDIQVAR
jgi:hypothetical protein